MKLQSIWGRTRGRYLRFAATVFSRRPFRMQNEEPLISFTFDDFPRSALLAGGTLLERHGVSGTYYASIGLMDQKAPTGTIFNAEELTLVCERGHELGCHTFAHCDASATNSDVFEGSVMENRRALEILCPGANFRTLSYPIGSPRPGIKKRCARHFLACRGGGQTCNRGVADLNNLRAFFIEQSRETPGAIRAQIDETCATNGWLIFATHDVANNHTRYGCDPELFEEIIRYSVNSKARVLPVSQALDAIGAGLDS